MTMRYAAATTPPHNSSPTGMAGKATDLDSTNSTIKPVVSESHIAMAPSRSDTKLSDAQSKTIDQYKVTFSDKAKTIAKFLLIPFVGIPIGIYKVMTMTPLTKVDNQIDVLNGRMRVENAYMGFIKRIAALDLKNYNSVVDDSQQLNINISNPKGFDSLCSDGVLKKLEDQKAGCDQDSCFIFSDERLKALAKKKKYIHRLIVSIKALRKGKEEIHRIEGELQTKQNDRAVLLVCKIPQLI
ncbi:hypothetical protein [Parendozoicomonas sp. Alg238-R29]|uniref:hypothetical protein n=1 Tax=Parendozoicomonas sp. Alg238-R29 TaxID=2993446 RepID=UPI00248F1EFC|nr:hypothetical protein [Parendozoicomonas sp. Alg238-R29]